jgi:hypothetical protein
VWPVFLDRQLPLWAETRPMTYSEAAVQGEFRDATQPHLRQAALDARRAALAQIAELRDSQHDLVRRLVLAPDELARAQLLAIEDEIVRLRSTVEEGTQ